MTQHDGRTKVDRIEYGEILPNRRASSHRHQVGPREIVEWILGRHAVPPNSPESVDGGHGF